MSIRHERLFGSSGTMCVHHERLFGSSGTMCVHHERLFTSLGMTCVRHERLFGSSGMMCVHHERLFGSSGTMCVRHERLFGSSGMTCVRHERLFLITEKIRTIKNNVPFPSRTACRDNSFVGNPLLTFESVTDEFVLKIISSAPAKSCELDPIPYENLHILLPTISTSLTTGTVPRNLKTAVVKLLFFQQKFDDGSLQITWC